MKLNYIDIKKKLDDWIEKNKFNGVIVMSLTTFNNLIESFGYEFDIDESSDSILYKGNPVGFRNMQEGSFIYRANSK